MACSPRFRDADGDGFGNSARPLPGCTLGTESTGDCNDGDPAIFPGAPEADCEDPIDYNCDGTVGYEDNDGDGVAACQDCDDGDAGRAPGLAEVCDGVDQDCDGQVDEDPSDAERGWMDADGDGFAGVENEVWGCAHDPDIHWSATDCDDDNPSTHPGAEEQCDGRDNDCDDIIAEALVPEEFSTIQAALDEGTWIDWVCVAPGTYEEDLSFPPWDIHLESMDGSSATVIDGSGEGSVVEIFDGTSLATTIEGFTIRGGAADMGGGLRLDHSSATLIDVVVRENECSSEGRCYGAGLSVYEGDTVLVDVTVTENSASGCDGVSGVGAWFNYATVEIWTSDFSGNVARDCGFTRGTGVAFWGVEGTMNNSSIRANSPSGSVYGSGLFATSKSFMDFENVDIAGNGGDANVLYGAAYHELWSSIRYSNSAFVNNHSDVATNYCHGVYLGQGMVLDLHNTDFTGNGAAAETHRGGVVCEWAPEMSGVTAAYTNLHGNAFENYSISIEDTEGMLSVPADYVDTSSEDPRDWDLRLAEGSALIDAGDPALLDPDESRSDVGAYGGPGASHW